jgi:hypothetical protein
VLLANVDRIVSKEETYASTCNTVCATAYLAVIFMVLANKNYGSARRTGIIVRLLTCSF